MLGDEIMMVKQDVGAMMTEVFRQVESGISGTALTEIPVRALTRLPALQAMTLALNQIWRIPDYAFQNLSSLVVL